MQEAQVDTKLKPGPKPKQVEPLENFSLLKKVELHSAITIDARTESTIMEGKIGGLERLEWLPSGFLLIQTNRSRHLLPNTAVKDSILK